MPTLDNIADDGTRQSQRVSSVYKDEQRQYAPALYTSKQRPWSADFKYRKQDEMNMEVCTAIRDESPFHPSIQLSTK